MPWWPQVRYANLLKKWQNSFNHPERHNMTEDQEVTQLPMMLTAIGQSIGYGEIDRARTLQKLAMDWAKTPDKRDEIYAKDFAIAAGWTGTSSGLD